MPEPTTERLARALEEANAPTVMIAHAREGLYDDYKSPAAFPIRQLVADLNEAGLIDLAKRAMVGEWDATEEEADAWAASPEGQATFRDLLGKR